MSLIRAAVRKWAPPPQAPAWQRPESYASLEEYAFGLMWHRCAVDQARQLVRDAVARFERQRDDDAQERQRREHVADEHAQRQFAAQLAAEKLLRSIGVQAEDELDDGFAFRADPAPSIWSDPMAEGPVDGDGRPIR